MRVYNVIAKFPVFSVYDVEKLIGNRKTAYSKFSSLIKKDLVRKIRSNIYFPVNPVTGKILASRYQIACAITDTAYISHHSAFEYYGLANQGFLDYCKNKIGKSRIYLSRTTIGESHYNNEWKLMVPQGLFEMTDEGGDALV